MIRSSFGRHYGPDNHRTTSTVMYKVMLALIPGSLMMTWTFGPGIVVNIIVATTAAMMIEAAVMVMRKRPVLNTLQDGSAVLAGWLLALCLPPLVPLWITAVGAALAMMLGKHVFGGLGNNTFNPAMVAYAILLISFPKELTAWIEPVETGYFLESIKSMMTLTDNTFSQWDSITKATPLDRFKFNNEHLALTWTRSEWLPINLAFLLGGAWLVYDRVISWQIPAALLGAVLFLYAIDYYLIGGLLSPAQALFSGALMLGAFFIATDPVTAATSEAGRLIYASGIGTLIFCIRKWGSYPEGVAFAVLLMNSAAPAIDYYCRPRTP